MPSCHVAAVVLEMSSWNAMDLSVDAGYPRNNATGLNHVTSPSHCPRSVRDNAVRCRAALAKRIAAVQPPPGLQILVVTDVRHRAIVLAGIFLIGRLEQRIPAVAVLGTYGELAFPRRLP